MVIFKRWFKKELILFAFLIVIFIPNIHAAVLTHLNISKAAPDFLRPIPNQSWSANNDLINAFNLNDYFEDILGERLNFTYTYVENITISIDASGNVSFYPDHGFVGIRNLTFTAGEEGFTTDSNLVFLFVGTDNEPPQWSAPSKSKNRIYQNYYINFSTFWTDNLQLKSYYFSINQGSGWISYPEINFSGIQNTSIYRVQISASPGTVVSWRFCASDSSFNSNCTDLQIFNVSSFSSPINPNVPETGEGLEGEEAEGGEAVPVYPPSVPKASNFSVDPNFFKVSLKQGESTTRVLKINNIGSTNLIINLTIIGLTDFLVLSSYKVNVSFGDSQKVTLDFSAKKDTLPEDYHGKIVLMSSVGYIEVPIVLEITPFEVAIDLDVNISEKYKSVMPGEIVKANVTIRNLKDLNPDAFTLYTAIKDIHGNIYDSYQEQIKITSIHSMQKNFTIPKDAIPGQYLFYARVFNNDGNRIVNNIDSDTFEVGQRFKLQAFLRSSLIFLFIVILSILSLFLVFRYREQREKEKILSLYLMLNELKELIKQEKIDQAIGLYIRIKNYYGEPVSKTELNKERLKEEIKILSKKINSQLEDNEQTNNSTNEKEKNPADKDEGPKPELKNESKEDNKEKVKPKTTEEKDKPEMNEGITSDKKNEITTDTRPESKTINKDEKQKETKAGISEKSEEKNIEPVANNNEGHPFINKEDNTLEQKDKKSRKQVIKASINSDNSKKKEEVSK